MFATNYNLEWALICLKSDIISFCTISQFGDIWCQRWKSKKVCNVRICKKLNCLMECLDNVNLGTNFRKYTFIMNFKNCNMQHGFFWISFYSIKTKSRIIMETVQSCLSYYTPVKRTLLRLAAMNTCLYHQQHSFKHGFDQTITIICLN